MFTPQAMRILEDLLHAEATVGLAGKERAPPGVTGGGQCMAAACDGDVATQLAP